ncbi:LPXTG cell wall anchor domain-containing protein [Brevibacterium sp. S111]|uniref:LPXTG cell wall anchor domain-containing protein n=1 Tax=Brevibacterium sp. S111 TaxID=2483795 RepID=UPI001080C0DE|nr:LPXTG cell wall anchor domain-containing protein [Brevibacterium sp. S111]TGD12524.1 LPXTG cell wall anchor domain-containing protein [Brevibacterium sp. S111]
MQKKLMQSSLALTAAAALGLGSSFVAGPAVADNGPQELNVQSDAKVQDVLEDVGGVNAYGAKNGQLTIGVSGDNDNADALEKKYSNVKVIKGIDALEPYAAEDLVGGAGYLVTAGASGGACSTGFSGWDADGKPIVLTAGHCAKIINEETNEFEGDTTVDETEQPSTAPANEGEGFIRSGLGVVGQWGYHKFGGELVTSDQQKPEEDDIDFAVINVDEAKYKVKTGVTDWSTADSEDLGAKLATDITKVGAHTEGTVEKAGRTTGLTENETWTALNEEIDFMNVGGRFVHGFGVKAPLGDPFSAPGDSGGGVFQGDTAVGVISGGGPMTDENGDAIDASWVADLDYSLEKSGKTISFEDPNEEPPGDDDKDTDSDAAADGKDADSDAAADGKDADSDAAADGKDADSDAAADGKDADSDAAADGKDADSDAAADGKDADSDADGNEKPEAPKVGDQTVVEGGQITGQAAPNAEVKLTWKPAGANAGSSEVSAHAAPAQGSTTVKTNANGKFTTEAPAEAGDYNYTAVVNVNGQNSAEAEFTVTVEAEEAPAERKLTVDPKEISAADFVKEDKGVQITAEGFEEGEKVTLEVVAGPENVEGITLDETANADGVVGFSIYGTSASNPEAYLGKYELEVTGANDTADESALTGSFQVVADEDGNGGGNDGDDNGNDDGNGDGGSDLPRTGAELTGLAAGAGLLIVGGAAVVLTMRRKKNN